MTASNTMTQTTQNSGVDTTALHARLLGATTDLTDASEVRRSIRESIVSATGAGAVVHMQADQHGHWLTQQLEISGTLPHSAGFVDDMVITANAARDRGTTQICRLTDGGNAQLICTPVSDDDSNSEVVAAILGADMVALPTALYSFELAGKYQRLWAKSSNASGGDQWKLSSLAAVIELVSDMQAGATVEESATIAAARTAKFLGAIRVAIALSGERGPKVVAVSGLNTFDINSESVSAMREAISECLMREDVTCWPPGDSQVGQANRAHRVLGERHNFGQVLTAPLVTPQGEQVGAWLFAFAKPAEDQAQLQAFVRTASPRAAAALDSVRRGNRGLITRLRERISSTWNSASGRAKWLIPVGLLGAMLFPLPYRVRCGCIVEPTVRQFAVAPFNGVLEQGFVRPGDVIEPDTLLARMDGREISLELSAAQAERGQANKKREMDLAERNVPKVMINQLEADRLQAKIDLLRYRRDNLELRSPIAGVVLKGDLERAQSAPVETGQVLYEIGPLDQLRIEVEVPADEVSSIQAGQKVKVWLEGMETSSITGKVDRLRPRSELREDRNVFVAEVLFENTDGRFRPGMRGSARITGSLRPLGWNLFHKPWEFLVSRLTLW